ncbi:type I methionyl aminopeptidase [Arsenicicoccus sp. oral taxon 190]|uniref:type I methionyl aminopeptidase n=1 Tax=Arsenicicoccus sp. oral taxon 190 TaxID=1658671 RepID=UPI00067A110E|nr:type I methionyl aminopeptidase [Arsenicicoccus sp. oral taxon 190]AKT51301.1 methionine aminopeptidase [Arsenicicoccus sp. oral taxon 190]
MFGRSRIQTRTDDQIRAMRRAGLVVGETLRVLGDELRAGMTTGQLDRLAETVIRDHGMRPNFSEVPGYRHTLCVSVGSQIVHGIPGERVLADGELVSVDCGCYVVEDGTPWHGDAARTFVVGGREAGSPAELALSDATEASLWAGIAALRVGGRLHDVGAAVEDSVEASGRRDGVDYGIVEDYVGHGIGTAMHMEPQVYNYRVRERGPVVRSGTTLAIEPMVTLGSPDNHVLEDDWTVVTDDGLAASHWENSVAVTTGGLWVLTEIDGGQAGLTAVGAPYAPLDQG